MGLIVDRSYPPGCEGPAVRDARVCRRRLLRTQNATTPTKVAPATASAMVFNSVPGSAGASADGAAVMLGVGLADTDAGGASPGTPLMVKV